ncbi:hypothetical protein NP493_314g00015 [Ridgeia piscesae]|uniref:Uncharacterized protein n=1 Tax=Ridgeia piscesae TaxID=27915 RepID=A0AAD9L6Z4_RIDPI|nr:hypothetical protein NP493_314g00015 [Ridgeia piscesae]
MTMTTSAAATNSTTTTTTTATRVWCAGVTCDSVARAATASVVPSTPAARPEPGSTPAVGVARGETSVNAAPGPASGAGPAWRRRRPAPVSHPTDGVCPTRRRTCSVWTRSPSRQTLTTVAVRRLVPTTTAASCSRPTLAPRPATALHAAPPSQRRPGISSHRRTCRHVLCRLLTGERYEYQKRS